MLSIKGRWPGIARAIKVQFITDFKWRTEHREYTRPEVTSLSVAVAV